MTVRLRPLARPDLPAVRSWLEQPHVARWWLIDSTVEREFGDVRDAVAGIGDPRTHLLTIDLVSASGAVRPPIGWCQWYAYADYPTEGARIGAGPGDCGIDYAIGDPTAVGRGIGRQLIAMLVAEVRSQRPGCGLIVDPDAENVASRRVLEHNGFELLEIRTIEGESRPSAIYRRSA